MDESTKHSGNGKTKESADDSLVSKTDEEEIVPTTPVKGKRGKRNSLIAETDEEENSAHYSSEEKEREEKQPCCWIRR